MGRNRQSMGSGISGAIVIIGVALALSTGSFNLPIFFVALAVASLVGSLSAGNPRAVYGGFIGFCWMLMLALFFITGSWLWFLVGAALSSVMGTLFKPIVERIGNTAFFGSSNQYGTPQQPYQPQPQAPYQPQAGEDSYEQGYRAHREGEIYQEGGRQYPYPGATPRPSREQPYPSSAPEMPEAQYPQQLPPQ